MPAENAQNSPPPGPLLCCKCKVPLAPGKAGFTYLKHHFSAEVPKCGQCGQVYISEELVSGKVAQVEAELEDK